MIEHYGQDKPHSLIKKALSKSCRVSALCVNFWKLGFNKVFDL